MGGSDVESRSVGGLRLSRVGFGAFKIGRNLAAKYPRAYELPTREQVSRLIEGLLDLGITYFDTAPAYGSSEERLGSCLEGVRDAVISTKVGEEFEGGLSRFDYSDGGIVASVERSLGRLRRGVLDIVFLHSDGSDLEILEGTGAVETLQKLKAAGRVRLIGFSGKTEEGIRRASAWSDLLMIEYSATRPELGRVIDDAGKQGIGVVVKKGLGSGRLPASRAVPFVLEKDAVTSLLIGSLEIAHMARNVRHASARRPGTSPPSRRRR
jgi:aryl-alcohol dehydrogenase-like predicted oxidoreductase